MCEFCEKANEEKAIEHLKNYPTNWIFPNVDKMAIDTVLELIEKQHAEIEKLKREDEIGLQQMSWTEIGETLGKIFMEISEGMNNAVKQLDKK